MTRTEFLRTLPRREAIYILFSRLTNLPYVECCRDTFEDEVYLITDRDTALERAKRLSDEGQTAAAMKVEQKDILRMFGDLFAYGVTGIVADADGTVLRMKLSEVVRRPDWEKLPAQKRPLENPELQISMIYYLQESRRKEGRPDPDRLAELEEEMAVNLIRAKYLLPVKETGEGAEKRTQVMLMRTREGETVVPIFSDTAEISRFRKEQGMQAALMTFEKLDALPLPEEVKRFVLNPAGANLPLTREYIRKELQLNRDA